MKILYYSVHSILEYDEIRLFKDLGHDVFPLGVNFAFTAIQSFRDNIVFNEREHELLNQFHAMGCHYQYGPQFFGEIRLTAEFVALFDVVVVMHDLAFVEHFWPVLSQRPVIWRTIGQMLELWEPQAASYKARGMHIVRYSPTERRAPNYCGETMLIRFAKKPDDYGPWRGDAHHVLTFANLLRQRYPHEADIYSRIVEGLPAMLGGVGNEGMTPCIGLLSQQLQLEHYAACRAYFYCSGPSIPYTLNFIEALITGMPVVAFNVPAPDGFCEIPDLLAGGAGIVVRDVEEARRQIVHLLDDFDHAAALAARGKARAIELFSADHIGPQWERLFQMVR